jgi:hypothetical protein
MLAIRRQGPPGRVRPAKPLNPRRQIGVIQVGGIAVAGVDEVIDAGAAAFEKAVDDADRLGV